LAPHQHWVIQSAPSDQLQTGSARLITTGNVGGFIRFRYDPTGQEAIVPLDSRTAAGYVLAFDNTNGIATGVAITNLRGAATTVNAVIRGVSGDLLGSGQVTLPAMGQTSFVLASQFSPTINQIGTIEFDGPAAGSIDVLGIRYSSGSFSTIPAIAP
jgi:hypothetical protein